MFRSLVSGSMPCICVFCAIISESQVFTGVWVVVQFQLFTALVFDDHYNGVPGAFALCSRAKAEDLASCMAALAAKCKSGQADWAPSSFIVDDCDAEIKAIRHVYIHLAGLPIMLHEMACSVLICTLQCAGLTVIMRVEFFHSDTLCVSGFEAIICCFTLWLSKYVHPF